MSGAGEVDDGPSRETMVQTTISIDGGVFALAQGQDVDALKVRLESAAQGGARFVEFSVVGNRRVSTLVSEHTHITLAQETVEFDPRDNGDLEAPYDGDIYDF